MQATELARIMNSTYPNPVIFLGYVVTKPHASRRKPFPPIRTLMLNLKTAAPYQILIEDGRVHDIDLLDYDRWYVLLEY